MSFSTIANSAQQMTVAGVWIAALGILGLLIRQVLPWRKQEADAQQQFRDELLARERTLIERIEKLEAQLSRQQIRHNAERALDRHRLNNITQCFDAMLLLVETTPEKASEIVTKIKQMRAAQMDAEAKEKAIIRAAEIEADAIESDHDGTEL